MSITIYDDDYINKKVEEYQNTRYKSDAHGVYDNEEDVRAEEDFVERLKEELKEVEEKPIEEFGKPCCENCKYNGKKQMRYKQSYYYREGEHSDYVVTGCEKTEDYWPNDGEHCYGFKHVEDWLSTAVHWILILQSIALPSRIH